MHEAMGPYSFVTFGTILLVIFLFTLFYLPETLGRSWQKSSTLQTSREEARATAVVASLKRFPEFFEITRALPPRTAQSITS